MNQMQADMALDLRKAGQLAADLRRRRAIVRISEVFAVDLFETGREVGGYRVLKGLRDVAIRGARYNADRGVVELVVESHELDPVLDGAPLPYFTPTFERLEQEVPT